MELVATFLAGLDFDRARDGIGQDIAELQDSATFGWFVLTVVFGLPAASLVALLRGPIALVPLAISTFVFAVWFLYYAIDLFSNPGQGVWMPMLAVVLTGWACVAYALLRPSSWRRPSASLTVDRPDQRSQPKKSSDP